MKIKAHQAVGLVITFVSLFILGKVITAIDIQYGYILFVIGIALFLYTGD